MTTTPPSADELRRRLYIALALNVAIVGGEFVGGTLIHSVGLMSDAMHNLIDQGTLFLTLYAHLLAFRPATSTSTFGYHRIGIVTALVNAVLLMMTAAGLMIVAVRRLVHPVVVPGGWVIVIALISFAANMGIAFLLQKAAKDDLNIRGAFWHMFGDAWVCFGVAASGLAIMLTHWSVIDPLISFVVVLAILKGATPVLKESLEILMESTPRGHKTADVVKTIQAVPGVQNLHDLHLWSLKPGMPMLTCHVMTSDEKLSQNLLTAIRHAISQECGIHHMNVQVESRCCHPDVVHCDLQHMVDQHRHSFAGNRR